MNTNKRTRLHNRLELGTLASTDAVERQARCRNVALRDPYRLAAARALGACGWWCESCSGRTNERCEAFRDGAGMPLGSRKVSGSRRVEVVFRYRARWCGFSFPSSVPALLAVVDCSDSKEAGRVPRTRSFGKVRGVGAAGANAEPCSASSGGCPSWLVELPAATER